MVLPLPVVYRATTGADRVGVSVLLAERLPGIDIAPLRLYRGGAVALRADIIAVPELR